MQARCSLKCAPIIKSPCAIRRRLLNLNDVNEKNMNVFLVRSAPASATKKMQKFAYANVIPSK